MNRTSLRRLPRNVWAVTLTSFFTDISSEMLVNLIPFFLANVLGVRTAVIGLIDGVAETTASLMKILSGSLSDKLGKRKWLTVAGYSLSAIAKPFLFFAGSWGWVLGVRFADRMGKGIRTAPRDALIADSINKEQHGLAFGLHRAGDTAGAFIGLGIAAFILWWHQSQTLMLDFDTFKLIVLAAERSFVSTAVRVNSISESPTTTGSPPSGSSEGLRSQSTTMRTSTARARLSVRMCRICAICATGTTESPPSRIAGGQYGGPVRRPVRNAGQWLRTTQWGVFLPGRRLPRRQLLHERRREPAKCGRPL